MINEIKKEAESIDELKVFNEIETHEGIAAKTQPQKKKDGVLKKLAMGVIGSILGLYTAQAVLPTNVYAQTPSQDKPIEKVNIGHVGDKGKIIMNVPNGGPVAVTEDGLVFVPNTNYNQDETKTYNKSNNTQTKVKYVPKFNYSTAKQYIDAANNAYAKKDYQKMITLSEEALYRINQGKIKANSDEIKKIEHRKDIGYEDIKR
jgi:hypothetical protein